MPKCEVRYCHHESELQYYGHETCGKCWALHCIGKINLKEEFDIKTIEVAT
ncbi:MAG: hypothetical protein Q8R04_00870 [Nanoarchaeota archaeon]|nr:hypothetical protein [Nanoarchaeota archaeon]